MDLSITIALDALVFTAYLFIVASGLTIVFGVMKVLNVAHGSMYAWGAYASAFMISYGSQQGWPVWSALVVFPVAALVSGGLLGWLLERGLRVLHGRDEVVVVLATFGVFLVLEDMILVVFGTTPYIASDPMLAVGSISVGGVARDGYGLLLIAVAGAVAAVCHLVLSRTRRGKLLQAVIHDREISAALGIDVGRAITMTFVCGSVLAAFAGALMAPIVSVSPGLGAEVIVMSFAVVVIGGMGSIPGALLGALLVGGVRSVAVHLFPEVEFFVIYLVMALTLTFRREGLFVPVKARRI